MVKKNFCAIEDVFRQAKKADKDTTKNLLDRLDCIEDNLQLKFIEIHEQRRRIFAETLIAAKFHTVS